MADVPAPTLSSVPTSGVPHDHGAEWVRGGWARVDLSQDIDVDSINFVTDVVDRCKVWEYLKMPNLCALCRDPKTDPVVPDRVHWLYKACVTCTDVFVCVDCASTEKFSSFKERSHRSCSFIWVTTRPLSAPLYDGSDLEQLVCFKNAQTAARFFKICPWIFHCLGGMDEWAETCKKRIQDIATNDPTMSLDQRTALLNICSLPTDWFARIYGSGPWQSFRQSMMPIIDARIQTAQNSVRIHDFVTRLQLFIDEKTARFGPGDIKPPHTPTSHITTGPYPESMHEFARYIVPLEFLALLNADVDVHKLEALRATQKQLEDVAASLGDLLDSQLVKANKNGIRDSIVDGRFVKLFNGAALHGRGEFRNSIRLWRVFGVLFRHLPAYDELQSPYLHIDISNYLEKQKSAWYSFLSKDIQIRTSLARLSYDKLPAVPREKLQLLALAHPSHWPASHPHARRLQLAEDYRHRGCYREAIDLLSANEVIDTTDPFVLLQRQLVYLSQGDYRKAADCDASVSNPQPDEVTPNPRTSVPDQFVASRLVALTSAYADCFVRGTWNEALREARDVFETYLESWQGGTRDNILLFLYLEIYYHRIHLEVTRDLGISYDTTSALTRLRSISRSLHELRPDSSGLLSVTSDILLLELDIKQRSVLKRYFDVENAFSVTTYAQNASDVVSTLAGFYSRHSTGERQGNSSEMIARLMLSGADRLLQENIEAATISSMIRHAEELLLASEATKLPSTRLNKHVGFLDIEALKIRLAGLDSPGAFTRLRTLYAELRARNDLRRLRETRSWNIPRGYAADTPEFEWNLYQRLTLQELARESGDNIGYERWKLRKYAGDDQAAVAIPHAERVLHSDLVHSHLLGTIASFNLSQAYLRTGNHFEAALNALLHHNLTAQRDCVESYHRAVKIVLQIFSEAFRERGDQREDILAQIAVIWNGWLTIGPYDRWMSGRPLCDEIDLFIDGACFLPTLASSLGRTQRFPDRSINQTLMDHMLAHLKIAFTLYEALPTYLASVVVPKLSLAVGAVAVYAGNKELAIRAYWEGMRSTHTQDLPSRARLQFHAGSLMTELGEDDPEHWLHVVPAGRGLLSAAATTFLMIHAFAGSMLAFCEAEVKLLESLACEARQRKIVADQKFRGNEGEVSEAFEQLGKIAELWTKACRASGFVEEMIRRIAESLNILSPSVASDNLLSLASRRFVLRERELSLEMCQIVLENDRHTTDRPWGSMMWPEIQKRKGSVLHQRFYSLLVPQHLLEAVRNDPLAWDLYQKEQFLLDQGPQSIGDDRLREVRSKMLEYPTTRPLIEHRRGIVALDAKNVVALADATKLTFEDSTNTLLIDWIQYHDYFLMVGYDVLQARVAFFEYLVDCTVAQVSAWVETHLKVAGNALASTLRSADVFKPLFPLVKVIKSHCKPGDLLVFCPSQLLHAVPLHALPYGDEDDRPIINYHPVVYTPSNNILKQCAVRVMEQPRGMLTARLLGRWGRGGNEATQEEQRIASSIESVAAALDEAGIKSDTTTGSAVTRDVLLSSIADASILHYHGHVDGQDLKQHLVLEPTGRPVPIMSSVSHPFYGRGRSERADIYTLKDVFATKIQASLVVLMGCASGTHHVSPSDDAVGLVSSFLAAGATSVVATLWPLDSSDASKFSEMFYREAFTKQAGKGLINLANALRTAVMEMQACQLPICRKRRSLEKRMKCHFSAETMSPYHWSQTVLWGSWFCNKDGKPRDSRQSEILVPGEKTKDAREASDAVEKAGQTVVADVAAPSLLQLPVRGPKTKKSPNREMDGLRRAAKNNKWLL